MKIKSYAAEICLAGKVIVGQIVSQTFQERSVILDAD
jgi:hypothetical protein